MPDVFRKRLQVGKDWLRRQWLGIGLRGHRLRTPFGVLVGTLRACGYLRPPLRALELFGMHGLWLTQDYARHCSTLEFYEIDPVYAAAARCFLPRADVLCTDSIRAVREGALKEARYDFIMVDNPMASPYGDGYYEHFDLFPHLAGLVESGVIVVNFVYAFQATNPTHTAARVRFYGNATPDLDQARKVYARHLESMGRRLQDTVFIQKNETIGYLALVVR